MNLSSYSAAVDDHLVPEPEPPWSPLRVSWTRPIAAAADGFARASVPHRYTSEAPAIDAPGELLGQVLQHATERWGRDGFLVDTQIWQAHPGAFPGIPVWSATPPTGDGVLFACLADEPLVEVAGPDQPVPLPPDVVAHLPDGLRLRFREPTHNQPVAIILVRPRVAGIRAWNRPRVSARIFSPRATKPLGRWPDWASRQDFILHSGFGVLDPMPSFTNADIGSEITLGGTSYAYARQVGGPIAQAWLDRVPADWRDAPDMVIGAGRNELSPGWQPAFLVWHMDGTSRAFRRSDGTADLRHPGRKALRLGACVGKGSPTAFLRGTVRLPEIPIGEQEVGGRVWAHLIQEHIDSGLVEATTAPSDQLFTWGWGGFHSCSESRLPGWRYFISASRRGDTAPNQSGPQRNGAIVWPSDGQTWPSDVLGIFPNELPVP